MSFYLKKNMSQKHVCPCKVLEKSMPQTIDSSSKNDTYIMDFPTADRLRHKKTTAAQVTTLTQYHLMLLHWLLRCWIASVKLFLTTDNFCKIHELWKKKPLS